MRPSDKESVVPRRVGPTGRELGAEVQERGGGEDRDKRGFLVTYSPGLLMDQPQGEDKVGRHGED